MKTDSRFRAAAAAFLLAASVSLPGADKLDLERNTPVPEGTTIPLQDFFRPALFRDPRINPGGTHIAALVTKGVDKYSLLVYDIAKQSIESVSGLREQQIGSFDWLTDRRLMFRFEQDKVFPVGVYAVEVGAMDRAYPLLQLNNVRFISVPPAKRDEPVIWIYYDSETRKDRGLAKLNTGLSTGTVVDINFRGTIESANYALIQENNERHIAAALDSLLLPGEFTTNYYADKTGAPVLATAGPGARERLYYAEGKEWKQSPIVPDLNPVFAAGNEPGQVIGLGDLTGGKPRPLQVMDVRTRQPVLELLQDKGYDFNGWLYRDPATHEIVGVYYHRGGPQSVWFTEVYRGLQKVLDGFFPGLSVRLLGSDEKLGTFLVETSSDRQPPIYYTVDLAKRLVALVKNSAPWIDPKRMRPTAIIKYKTRDGRALDAYVTMPAGATKENPPPLVVLAHGWLEPRATWRFEPTVQFLASRGYAVLQPNLRRDEGYRWMVPHADEWDVGKMHDDVTDAARTLVKSGLVDRNRVAIMGERIGGYLALSGLTREAGLYRCAVSIGGLYDWADWFRDRKFYELNDNQYEFLTTKIGDPAKEKDKFAALSPVNAADKAAGPVFVAHMKDDGYISVNQATKLISALKDHNVECDTFLIPDEFGDILRLDTRVELYGRIEAFLAKHLATAKP